MIVDVEFSRNRFVTWLLPGYHSELKKLVGKTVSTTSGRDARLVKIEFNVEWKQFSSKEKKQAKQQFGDEVKSQYHRFTRATLDKTLFEQEVLPFFSEPHKNEN